MPDAPDDFEYSDVGEFTANLDSSELAARLYSPAIYARTGQILYMTDFTKGLSGLEPNTTGAAQSVNVQTQYAMYGGLSLKLQTESSDEGDCYVGITIPYVKARYYILDTGYFLWNAGTEVRIELYVYDGDNRYTVNLWHTYNPFELQINNGSNVLVDVTDLAEKSVNFGSSNHLRIIIDTETGLYKRLTLNSINFEVTSMSFYTVASTTYPNLATYHSIAYSGAVHGLSYLQWLVISATDNLYTKGLIMKNWNTIIRDAGRVVVCWGIVGAWLYCVVSNNPAKTEILMYGMPIALTILGFEGVLKWLDGKGNGRYIKGEHE